MRRFRVETLKMSDSKLSDDPLIPDENTAPITVAASNDGRKKPRTPAQQAAFEKARAAQKVRQNGQKDLMQMLAGMSAQYMQLQRQQQQQQQVQQQQKKPLQQPAEPQLRKNRPNVQVPPPPPDAMEIGDESEPEPDRVNETAAPKRKRLSARDRHRQSTQRLRHPSPSGEYSISDDGESLSSSSASSSSSSGDDMKVARDWEREKKHFGYEMETQVPPRKPRKRSLSSATRNMQSADPDHALSVAQLRHRDFQSHLGF